jgi:hypothetical protein
LTGRGLDVRYWDYVRVYVPAGSRLLEGPGLDLAPAGYGPAAWAPAELPLRGPACTDLRTDGTFEAVYRITGER